MTLLLARTEREVEAWKDPESRVLWLSEGAPPEALRHRAVTLPDDPPLVEGWLAVRRLGDTMAGGQTLKEALTFDGVSLWWFVHYWLVYGDGFAGWDDRYRVLHRLVVGLETEPGPVVLLTDRAGDDLVARAVTDQKGVAYRWTAAPLTQLVSRLDLRWRAEALIRLRMAKLLVRGWLARRIGKNSLTRRGTVDIVFNTSSGSWDARSGRERILGPVIAEAEKRGLTVAGLHLDYRRNLGVDTLRILDRRIVAWESAITLRSALRALGRGRAVARSSLGGTIPGQILGIEASRLLADRIPVLIGARLPDAVLAIEASRKALARLQPGRLCVVDAYDLWGQALVVAARERKIASIELQHGVILGNHGGYLHLDGEVAPDGDWRAPFAPVPNVVAVWGEAAKQALIEEGRFPAASIAVTGSPTIEAARQQLDARLDIRRGLGLLDGRTTVLFFGVPPHVFPSDEAHVRAFLDACRRLPDIRPVLRPHPIDLTNPQRYRDAATDAGVEAPVLEQANPLDLIIAADVVIAYNSTTALDAMALGRSVIHVNLSGVADLFPFVHEGHAVGVTSRSGLYDALALLMKPEARKVQAERQLDYADRNFARCPDPASAILELGFPDQNRQ